LRRSGPAAPDPGQPDSRVPAPDAATQPPAPGARSLDGPGRPTV
jgi:hypothetical protein